MTAYKHSVTGRVVEVSDDTITARRMAEADIWEELKPPRRTRKKAAAEPGPTPGPTPEPTPEPTADPEVSDDGPSDD